MSRLIPGGWVRFKLGMEWPRRRTPLRETLFNAIKILVLLAMLIVMIGWSQERDLADRMQDNYRAQR